MKQIKWILYALLGGYLLYSLFFKGSGDDTITEEVEIPTKGMVTTVQEVESELFKITDEVAVENPTDSRIIANYMDNTADTFTLEEAQLIAQSEGSENSRSRSLFRAASYGLMGYMMGRSMSTPIRSSAYMDQKTYNRVNNNAGQTMRSTAKRTTVQRPGGKSGYGGSKSTRSYGG